MDTKTKGFKKIQPLFWQNNNPQENSKNFRNPIFCDETIFPKNPRGPGSPRCQKWGRGYISRPSQNIKAKIFLLGYLGRGSYIERGVIEGGRLWGVCMTDQLFLHCHSILVSVQMPSYFAAPTEAFLWTIVSWNVSSHKRVWDQRRWPWSYNAFLRSRTWPGKE